MIKSRINEFLSKSQLLVEFDHGVLHKQNILDRLAQIQNKKKQQDRDYYKKLQEEVKNMVIPKREFKDNSPEVINKVQKKLEVPITKPTPQKYPPKPLPSKPPSNFKQPQSKNQGYLNPSPKKVNQKISPNPGPEQIIRPESNQVLNRRPNEYVGQKAQVVKPVPNFYVHDYKPYKYEEPAGVMMIPIDAKNERKPQSQADQRKKLEELKEKAKKIDQRKEELRKEQKKKEKERNERKKKLDQDRINMRKDIEKKRRCWNKFDNKDFGLVQVPGIIATDSLNASPNKPQVTPPKLEPPNTTEEVKEVARGTAKFAEEEVKIPAVRVPAADPLIKSKSIVTQVDQLTRSIIEKQKAKLKKEEELEKDVMELAIVYKDVTFPFIIGFE